MKCEKYEQRRLLYNMCGYAYSGEIMAIVGPSGGGKTTLLNVLAQRYSRNDFYSIKADIRVNDVPLNKTIFRRIGSFI